MYWILNKDTMEPAICGSIKAVAKLTDIKPDSLYYQFSKKKKKEFENDKWRISKNKLIRS